FTNAHPPTTIYTLSLHDALPICKELSKMEENMAAKATDPNQLSQLAWRFKEDGELDKAIELWRKADKMGTGYPWVKSQLAAALRSEEHTSELQSRSDLVCRLLLE